MLTRLRPLLVLVVCAVVVIEVFDAAVFRNGFYLRWCEPHSTMGEVIRKKKFIARHYRAGRPNFLVFGDSRITEGFSQSIANATAGPDGPNFINAGVPGSSVRDWYYILREIDPAANRFRGIALAVKYDFTRRPIDSADMTVDIHYSWPQLRLTDLVEFSNSFHSPEAQQQARRALLFPMQIFREDLVDFIHRPAQRLRALDREEIAQRAMDRYQGRNQRVPDLLIDPATKQPREGPVRQDGLTPALIKYFNEFSYVAPPELKAGNEAYQVYWLNKIIARYQGQNVRLIIFCPPRGPWDHRLSRTAPPFPAMARLVKSGSLRALPADAFVDLEKPDYFADTLHLNRSGRTRFSPHLARRLADELN